jgi:hypothetical protein
MPKIAEVSWVSRKICKDKAGIAASQLDNSFYFALLYFHHFYFITAPEAS